MHNERKPRIVVSILNGKRQMSREAGAYPDLVHRAMDLAAQAHDGQYRKNRESKIPYLSHCAMVGQLLLTAGFDEEVAAAGILHDTVEDTGITEDMLAERFGDRVAGFVAEVTEKDKSLPWETRKARYIEGMKAASTPALAISCADKIHNLWSLILYQRSGRNAWSILKRDRETQIERFEKLAGVFRARFDHPLRDVFEEAFVILKREC
jgi:(p)ppGpp synthase/HD superfamily hydrolase